MPIRLKVPWMYISSTSSRVVLPRVIVEVDRCVMAGDVLIDLHEGASRAGNTLFRIRKALAPEVYSSVLTLDRSHVMWTNDGKSV